MFDRSEWTLEIVVAILIVALAILAILVWRHGRTVETKAILDAIEAARAQTSVHEQVVESRLKTIQGWVLRILNRFGFLTDLTKPRDEE